MKFMGRAARMARHHKRNKAEGEINLVSMIDMLTVLVFFLLVYTTTEIEILPNAKDVQLPQSMAEQATQTEGDHHRDDDHHRHPHVDGRHHRHGRRRDRRQWRLAHS